MSADDHPAHLDPSELGTKEYWDAHYAQDLDLVESHGGNGDDDDSTCPPSPPPSPSDLASWFDDVDAPARTLAFLTSPTFPLSPNYNDIINDDSEDNATNDPALQRRKPPSILDLGTGNGATLFQLRLRGNFTGPMLGVDYSPQSIQLARSLARRYASSSTDDPSSNRHQPPGVDDIQFQVLDIIHTNPATQPWWPPAPPGGSGGGFDLVLDKGTFDAISLSSETVTVTVTPPPPPPSRAGRGSDCGPRPQQQQQQQVRVSEIYPTKVISLIKPGGFLLVTSCNWTEDEVVRWFTTTATTATATATSPGPSSPQGTSPTVASAPRLELYATVPYPKYTFGGHEGQGVVSVCFRRVV